MAFSPLGMSAQNAALLKKFEGNGWAVTCSAASQGPVSAMLGRASGSAAEETNTPVSELTAIEYEPDWADKVIGRSMRWRAVDGSAPLWVVKATESSDFALFQLPPPDHRWIVKFAGKILNPFSYRFLGWADLQEIMVHGFLLDRAALLNAHLPLPEIQRRKGNLLRSAELTRNKPAVDVGQDTLDCNVSGAKLHGLDTQTGEGKIESDRWRTCADDFNRQLQKRLNRLFDEIAKQDDFAADALRKLVRYKDGYWSFKDSVKWQTTVADIPYDAQMVLKGTSWEVNFPDSAEVLTVPDSPGMRAIARVLMSNNIACPCALVVDGPLLTEFLRKPRHHQYFEATYRKPKVMSGDAANGEVEQEVCAAMRLKSGRFYVADHLISDRSELHTVCGVPIGRVTLKQADALQGVRDLVKKQQARLFFCSPPSKAFKRILSDLEAGIEYARKHEGLLEQVQPRSEESQDRVHKAIYRAKECFAKLGDWTTRFDRLARHFDDFIRGGLVLQYVGPYRWKIEGIGQTPEVLDLASDHKAFKHRRARRTLRRLQAKMEAVEKLNTLVKGAAC